MSLSTLRSYSAIRSSGFEGLIDVPVHYAVVPCVMISFTRYFYKSQPLRALEKIRADIVALETETDGLLAEITDQLGGRTQAK